MIESPGAILSIFTMQQLYSLFFLILRRLCQETLAQGEGQGLPTRLR